MGQRVRCVGWGEVGLHVRCLGWGRVKWVVGRDAQLVRLPRQPGAQVSGPFSCVQWHTLTGFVKWLGREGMQGQLYLFCHVHTRTDTHTHRHTHAHICT